ncbi:MAG: DUF2062 domain-containing protein [Bacteroidales bacterium]|jgi:glycosyltransferase involved in cell wall biosynthesis|nr:DUF2062 domain-containing protein [Bacteroidales bacterium]
MKTGFGTLQDRFDELRCCVVIPSYNNAQTLAAVLDSVLAVTSSIIVVDDGSTDDTPRILDTYKHIERIRFSKNKGKGYALRKAFKRAADLGYCHAISMDSDGQHMADDLPVFLDVLDEHPGSLIIGARNMQEAGAPGKSNFGLRFSNFWYRVCTGIKLPDTQSGFRLYPLDKIRGMKFFTRRFEFEVEVIVRAAWKKIRVTSVPVKVYYPPGKERISHFRPFTDFARISILNTVLVLLALLWYRPYLFFSRLTWKSFKQMVRRELFKPDETNGVKVASVMVGAFMGVAPVWGWQMAIALGIAIAFRLNKIIVLAVSNISIPPMIPIILYLSYISGGMVMGRGAGIDFSSDITLEFVTENLLQYILGSLVLGVVLACLLGLITYILLFIFRKNPVAGSGNK